MGDMATNYDVDWTGEVDEKGRRVGLYNGIMVREVSGGALQRIDNGHLAAPPETVVNNLQPVRNSESAKALAYIRWHGKREAAIAQAVNEHLADGTIRDIDTADAEIVGILVRDVVLNPKVRGKDRIDAWLAILEQSGMSGKAPKQADNGASSAIAGQIGGEMAQLLLLMAEELRKERAKSGENEPPDVIDGIVK